VKTIAAMWLVRAIRTAEQSVWGVKHGLQAETWRDCVQSQGTGHTCADHASIQVLSQID
jgi:hypothetical protein